MDGSFFAFALIGALVGYIVGDFQRERRYRREAHNNLALANARADGNTNGNGQPVPVPDSDGYSDGDRNRYTGSGVRREARRAAVRGDNYGLGAGTGPVGRNFRSAVAPPVGKRRAEIDCF